MKMNIEIVREYLREGTMYATALITLILAGIGGLTVAGIAWVSTLPDRENPFVLIDKKLHSALMDQEYLAGIPGSDSKRIQTCTESIKSIKEIVSKELPPVEAEKK